MNCAEKLDSNLLLRYGDELQNILLNGYTRIIFWVMDQCYVIC